MIAHSKTHCTLWKRMHHYLQAILPHHVIITSLKVYKIQIPLWNLHDRLTPVTLSPKPLAYDKPIDPTEMPHISTCIEMTTEDTNVPTQDDKYPWLDPDDKQQHMTDAEILRMELNLADCELDDKGKEDFLAKTDNFHDVFSLRDEIATCPFIEVHLKLKDETPFFV